MTALDFSKVGFIGLGAMGKHMVEHLATKLPNDSRIFLYDISSPPMDELVLTNNSFCPEPGNKYRKLKIPVWKIQGFRNERACWK